MSVYRRHMVVAWALVLAFNGAAAAAYPERAVRIIVPSPPGGGTDASTRIVARKLAELLGQQFIIDNRPGASGNIGAEQAVRATPDGYTLLAILATHTSNPALMGKGSYDLMRDFAPISVMVTLPNLIISHPSLPVKTARELIAFAKARPGQLHFASAGMGTIPHLTMELFLSMAGLKMIHVPYKGVGPALIDVVAGHVPVMGANILVLLPHVRHGRVRAYGVTSAKRAAVAPEIPTIAEGGLAGYEALQWYGIVAPASTPRDTIASLHRAMVRALQESEVARRFTSDGADPTPSKTPEEFGALIRSEIAKWAKVVKDAGIKPD